ncbi:MAG: PhoX family protein, partial [Thiobacillus sp.]|nr:PhoX family protein [Thiobacillus sp.]
GAGYDALAGGGAMVLDLDASGRLVRQFVALAGTHVNCAGGYAWQQRAWLSCEETADGPKQGYGQKHGYVFAVPADSARAVDARPLIALGRFRHEAACADADGVVYLTEDAGSARGSGFYRFLPNDRADLARGGRLQMLRAGVAFLDARQRLQTGVGLGCDWVDIDDPDPDLESGRPGCFEQGRAAGATRFNRLEGLWLDADGRTVYFTSTAGGDAKSAELNADGFVQGYGQVWRYSPSGADRGVLTLHFESPGGSVLDSPDNLCVTPQGGLLLCEDDASPKDRDRHPLAGFDNVNRLVGIGRDGVPFVFAVNLLNASELAGACFSPDGRTLYVNVYGDGTPASGMSCAISGPWQAGPL